MRIPYGQRTFGIGQRAFKERKRATCFGRHVWTPDGEIADPTATKWVNNSRRLSLTSSRKLREDFRNLNGRRVRPIVSKTKINVARLRGSSK